MKWKFCDFQLNELEHLKGILCSTKGAKTFELYFYFQLKESLPPSHIPIPTLASAHPLGGTRALGGHEWLEQTSSEHIHHKITRLPIAE